MTTVGVTDTVATVTVQTTENVVAVQASAQPNIVSTTVDSAVVVQAPAQPNTIQVTTESIVVAQPPADPSIVIVVADGPQGPQGPQGIPGSGGHYLAYNQTAPQSTWLISHNFGIRPTVQILDSFGAALYANITHLDSNVTQIDFSVAASGSAILMA